MFLGKWYEWLWQHTTGRPYTYIIRDFYHEVPALFILLEAWLILLLNHFFRIEWWVWIIVSIGILLGHLFWGKDWIPNEGEKTYKK